MSSFFNPPPPPRPPEAAPAPTPPPWIRPPAGVLGELVTDRVILFRSDELVVSMEHLHAYPEGFEFRLCLRTRHPIPGLGFAGPIGITTPSPIGFPGRMVLPVDQQLRLGLGFADGRRVTNLSPLIGVGASTAKPVLVQQGASAIGGRWDQRYWVWGLPPEGRLTVAVEAAAWGVPETLVELAASEIREAAGRAEVLWKDEAASPSSGGYPGDVAIAFAPEPESSGEKPPDLEKAHDAIASAFAAMQQFEGDELLNVDGGQRLAPTLRALQGLFDVARTAVHRVDRVVFVSATHAAVWFSVWLGQSPFLTGHRGEAVLVDGRWKVSRETFCGLLARVGVPCPDAQFDSEAPVQLQHH